MIQIIKKKKSNISNTKIKILHKYLRRKIVLLFIYTFLSFLFVLRLYWS